MRMIVIDGCPIAMGKTTLINHIAKLMKQPPILICDDVFVVAKTSENEYNTDFYFRHLIKNEKFEPMNTTFEEIIRTQSLLNGYFLGYINEMAKSKLYQNFIFSREPFISAIFFACLRLGTCDQIKDLELWFRGIRAPIPTAVGVLRASIFVDYEDILLKHAFKGDRNAFMEFCYNNMIKRGIQMELETYPNLKSFMDNFTIRGNINTFVKFKQLYARSYYHIIIDSSSITFSKDDNECCLSEKIKYLQDLIIKQLNLYL